MKEARYRSMDAYFRSPDTVLAKTIRRISLKTGDEYRGRSSVAKRVLDVGVAAPLWVVSRPVEIGLRAAVRVSERKSAIYRSERIRGSEFDTITVRKIRSMHEGSDTAEKFGDLGRKDGNGGLHDDNSDPRVTRIGKIMRPLKLDELPQLWDVLAGKLSIIGIRVVSVQEWKRMSKELPKEKFEKWEKKYVAGRPGGGHLFDILRSQNQEISRRYRYDMFYADHASMGFELYMMFRYAKRLVRKFKSLKKS
jgi:lipopolysaccharide/colanic/teichoic acid biosynthesis glycosyltransferase